MKPLLTIIATLLISATTCAQSNVTEFKRLLIGVTISPDYCYRTLKNNDGSTSSDTIIGFRNDYESPKFGYSAGLSVGYRISNRLGLEASLQYSSKGEKLETSDLFFSDPIDPRNGLAYAPGPSGSAIDNIKYISNYNYIDAPLRAIFSFGKGKMNFLVSPGITVNFLLNATQTTIIKYKDGDTDRKTRDQPYDFNSINISPTASVGIGYRLSDKIHLQVEPTFRYGLLKIIDTPVTSYLWSGGLNISCYYALR